MLRHVGLVFIEIGRLCRFDHQVLPYSFCYFQSMNFPPVTNPFDSNPEEAGKWSYAPAALLAARRLTHTRFLAANLIVQVLKTCIGWTSMPCVPYRSLSPTRKAHVFG